jgi:hypothetical protein
MVMREGLRSMSRVDETQRMIIIELLDKSVVPVNTLIFKLAFECMNVRFNITKFG